MELQDYIEIKLVHEIHTSERKSFRACRRRWDWLFRDNYYPKVTAKPLEFGVAFHKGMEVYYDPATWNDPREIVQQEAIKAFVDSCEEQKTKAILEFGHLYLENEQEQDYAERVELGRGMLNYYFTRVAPQEDIGWVPVKVEIGFMVAIPNPETGEEAIWCKCDHCWEKIIAWGEKGNFAPTNRDIWIGLPVVYAGRLDMLAQDHNGAYWIFDWKTARSIAEKYDFLYLDDQVASYVWALRKLGLKIMGFVYHEQRKGFPLPPKKNVNRRLGRMFSVAQNQDTGYDIYLETVSTEDNEAYEAGLYDDFLEFLKNDGIIYYMRHQIAKSDAEMEETERNIGFEALDMIDPSLRIYPSPGRFGCNFCAFQTPCIEANSQGDYKFALNTMFEIKEPYYVRAEKGPSTESKGGE